MEENLSAGYVFDHIVPSMLKEQPEIAKRVNAVLGIELIGENGGYWTLDLTDNPAVVRGRSKEPRCTVSAHVEDFEALLAGGSLRDALDAFKKKRIQASGHLPTILKLEHLLVSLARKGSI